MTGGFENVTDDIDSYFLNIAFYTFRVISVFFYLEIGVYFLFQDGMSV